VCNEYSESISTYFNVKIMVQNKKIKTFSKDMLFDLIRRVFANNTPIFYSNKIFMKMNESLLNDINYMKQHSHLYTQLVNFCQIHNLYGNTTAPFLIVLYDPSHTSYGFITTYGYMVINNSKNNLSVVQTFMEKTTNTQLFKYTCDDGTIETSPNFIFALFTNINHETRCIAMKFVAEILMNSGDCEQDILISGKNMYKALPQSFKVVNP